MAQRMCPRCGKIIRPTKKAAKDALLRTRIARALRGRMNRKEKRFYPCPVGNGWHLTSK